MNSHKKTRRIIWPHTIYGFLGTCIGLVAIIYAGIIPLYQMCLKLHWQAVEAQITSHSFQKIVRQGPQEWGSPESPHIFIPHVRFSYTWNNTTYENIHNGSPHQTFYDQESVQFFLDGYPPNSKWIAHINPNNPQQVLLTAHIWDSLPLIILFLSCIWTLAHAFVFYIGVKSVRIDNSIG